MTFTAVTEIRVSWGLGGRSGEEETEIYLTVSHEGNEILRSGYIMADQVKFPFLNIAVCSPR